MATRTLAQRCLGPRLAVALEWKWQDCWIGWYGPVRWTIAGDDRWEWWYSEVWICLLPMLPLHIRWWAPGWEPPT